MAATFAAKLDPSPSTALRKLTSSEQLASVSIRFNASAPEQSRQELVDRLFSGVQFDEPRQVVVHQGHTYTALRGSDRGKTRLLSLFGASRTLAEVDASIHNLIAQEAGWLNSAEDREVVIKSAEITADLEALCELVLASLSLSMVRQVKTLINNLHALLSCGSILSTSSQVDVTLVERDRDEIVAVHSRYSAESSKRRWALPFFGANKKLVRVAFNLRSVCVTHEAFNSLDSDDGTFTINLGKLERSPMPAQRDLRRIQSEPPGHSPPQANRPGLA